MTPIQETLRFAPVGDKAVTAVFGDTIDPAINRRIRHTVQALQTEVGHTIEEMVSTYSSILVIYDPLKKDYDAICDMISAASQTENETAAADKVRVVEIPTVYGGEYGMDMDFVAEHAGLTASEVINIHSGTDYLVYMLGFIPGFTYLGGMDERIATPRLTTPRTLIPAGSVGIAGHKRGCIHPIRRAAGKLSDAHRFVLYDGNSEKPTLLEAGDYVRYVPVSEEEFFRY